MVYRLDWAWVYQNFVNLNYDVLVLDYRKFGKSTGNWSEENFINDAQYVYNELKKNYKENEIVIYGRSIGTGIATQLAANNQPKALILETPYYNIEDLAKRMLPIFPVKYLSHHQEFSLLLKANPGSKTLSKKPFIIAG